MELKPHPFAFQILESDIDHLYRSLNKSSNRIFQMVSEELELQGIYNPKVKAEIISDDVAKFESFQGILRNLNNFIYFNSLLLGSYAIFEVSIKRICEFVGKYSSPKHDFIPPTTAILKGCRKYLIESSAVNFANKGLTLKYDYLTNIGKVRNLIAHHNGNIFQKRGTAITFQPNYQIFKNIDGITVLDSGQVYINNEDLIITFIKVSEALIKLIISDLKSKTTTFILENR